MFEPLVAYVIAICAAMFSAVAAIVLIRTISHFDPPEARDREHA